AYYVEQVKKEIANKHSLFKPRVVDTVYFGGGTPSLISAELIVELISELNKFGYVTGPQTEITIEINPATVDEKKLDVCLKAGVNRFSVGAQTFSDRLLKMVHREHNSEQTLKTLQLLKKYKLNFSFDILFALPTQTIDELRYDVSVAVELGSKHISPYCLTVPEGHPLSKNRPLEEEQIEMFDIIDNELAQKSFIQYELSNYALKGFESQHNLLYWTDQEYWGLGLSAHSYSKASEWGSRFWNLNSFDLYSEQMQTDGAQKNLSDYNTKQIENLNKAQSLTDFCYTSLRLKQGLSVEKLVQKFGPKTLDLIEKQSSDLISRHFMTHENDHLSLTRQGQLISNQIFEKFAFFAEELTSI
ncbi:MAG: coproporphyrinogen-III oxidase family protein, partial [Pseudobdellovibrio sp.]